MGVTGTLSSHIFGTPCFELPFPPLHVNNHSVDALDSNFLLEAPWLRHCAWRMFRVFDGFSDD